jgi:hypothetical protein
MSTEINSNFSPKIGRHIDERLSAVTNFVSLPNPNVATNFLYIGALRYVINENAYYRVEDDGLGNLIWVKFDYSPNNLVLGALNITNSTSILDLSLVNNLQDCYGIVVNIINGNSATITSIVNFPSSDKLITFYVTDGQQLTFKHFDFDVAGAGQVVLENGFDLTIRGRSIGNESLTLIKHNLAICQWDAVQFVKQSEWLQNLLAIAVEDNLTSTSTTTALSANQGRILKDMVDLKQDQLIAGPGITIVPGINNATISSFGAGFIQMTLTGSNLASFNAQLTTNPELGSMKSNLATLSAIPGFPSEGISGSFRYFDFNFGDSSNVFYKGSWVIPPGLDPTVSNNWVMISPFSYDTEYAKYLPDSFISLEAGAAFLNLNTSTKQGILNVNYGSSFVPNRATNFNIPVVNTITGGAVEITYNITLEINDVNPRQFEVFLMQGNALGAEGGAEIGHSPVNFLNLLDISTVSGRRINFSFTYSHEYLASTANFSVKLVEATNDFSNIVVVPSLSSISMKRLK